MNTLLTACILEARSPGITEQWPLMVLAPIEKTRHEAWMGYTPPIKLEVAAVSPGDPRMHGPARQFSSWKDACEAMGWPYDRDRREADAISAAPPVFVPVSRTREVTIYKGRAVGPTTLSDYIWHAIDGFWPKLVRVPTVAERRYVDAFADSPNVDQKWVDDKNPRQTALELLAAELRRPLKRRPDQTWIGGVCYGPNDPLPLPFGGAR